MGVRKKKVEALVCGRYYPIFLAIEDPPLTWEVRDMVRHPEVSLSREGLIS